MKNAPVKSNVSLKNKRLTLNIKWGHLKMIYELSSHNNFIKMDHYYKESKYANIAFLESGPVTSE